MTIEQTVEIHSDRRLILDLPPEIPTGKTQVLIQFPALDETLNPKPIKDHKYWWNAPDDEVNAEVERRLGRPPVDSAELKLFHVLIRTQGAWADNPWENCIEDIRAMREEWDHRDPWNPDPAKRHRD